MQNETKSTPNTTPNTRTIREIHGELRGYLSRLQMPVKKGDIVVIPAGTRVKTMHPQRDFYTLKRRQRVKVHHVLGGFTDGDKVTPPVVCWAGAGGYWCEVDINDVIPRSFPQVTAKSSETSEKPTVPSKTA